MARPNFSVKHIPDSEQIPKKLIRGRLYFVEDEGIILVDHGQGVRQYGHKHDKAIEYLPGQNVDDALQEQIDDLTDSVNALEALIFKQMKRTHAPKPEDEEIASLQEQVNDLTDAVNSLSKTVYDVIRWRE